MRRSLRSSWRRRLRGLREHAGRPGLVFTIWFVLSFGALLWMWGGVNPLVFPTPDEAVVRSAARAIAKTGSPTIPLPFPDPEDLAHPRSWVTLGDHFVPTYAPALLYAFGYLLRLGTLGLGLVFALPASAVAAFAAGSARLVPKARGFLGLLAPALAFPALYWLLRPWVNVSPLLSCSCWAFYCWTSWRQSEGRGALGGVGLFVSAAAAIRPDYAAFLLVAALLLCLAAKPARWRSIFAVCTVAGACALGLNLLLNQLLTGHPLRAAYQVALERQWGADDAPSAPGLGALRVLLVPMGWPKANIARAQFAKYWLQMGPIAGVLLGQLAIVPLLRGPSRLSRALYLGACSWFAFLVYTRLHDDVFGGQVRAAWVEHSVPRYLTPAYLFCVLPPLALLGRLRRTWLLIPALLLACGVAGAGLYEIAWREPWSLRAVRDFVPANQALLARFEREIPGQAMVYSVTSDKLLWSGWRLGTIDNLDLSAASMARAERAGVEVYMHDPKYQSSAHQRLGPRLDQRGLSLLPIDVRHGLYRLRPNTPR